MMTCIQDICNHLFYRKEIRRLIDSKTIVLYYVGLKRSCSYNGSNQAEENGAESPSKLGESDV